MYTPKQINELKSNPAILQVVEERVPSLEQIGQEWKGSCPFHQEDTPSFTVRQDDGVFLFKCFGCGKNGNLIQFVQYVDNISFNQAVEKAATIIGWKKGKESVEQAFKPLKEEKETLTFPLAKIYDAELALCTSAVGLAWLASRGISLETANQFRLGYVQSAKAVNPHHPWVNDGWIIFPTHENGIITSLKYRSVKGKKTETGEPGFLRKSGMATGLFNLQAVEPFEDAYLVEGEPDCMVLAQAGLVAVSLPSAGYNLRPDERDALLASNRVFLAGDMDNPGQQAMTKLWTELRERTYKIEWPQGMKDANQTFLEKCNGNVEEFKKEVESLKKKALEQPIPFIYDLRQTLRTGSYMKPMDDPARLRIPWATVDNWGAILPSDVMAVSATETGTGKALKNGTPVLTPDGWYPIELLKTGGFVFGADGRKTEILGVFPQGIRPLYRVKLSCSTEIVCDRDHLWTVETSNHNRRLTTTTQDLAKRLWKKNGTRTAKSYPWKVPTISPVQFPNKPFPLHPYLMGALIGDGGLTGTCVKFSSVDDEILAKVAQFLPPSIELQHQSGCDYRICRKGYRHEKPSWLREVLRFYKLLGEKSERKFIPTPYLFGSVEQRLDLLRGLLDTDGTVGRISKDVSFNTSSPVLAEQVKHLVFSLGGFAFVRNKKTKCLPSYNVSINMPLGVRLFWLTRKHVLAEARKGWKRVRAIRSIEPCGVGEATCIKVAASDGLFLTTDFVPTHNTSWIMNILLHNAIKFGKVVVNYSAELSPKQYSVRAAAHLLNKKKDDITEEDLNVTADLMGEAQFYNGYKPGANWKEVIELLAWAKRRLGADILVLDHLHFLTRSERDETRAQSEAMRMLKDLAVQYNIIMIVLGQPRKPLANHRGREMVTQDLKGSETFGSDASQVFILHRDRKSNGDDSNLPIFDPICKVKLDKSRESEPRATKLFFDGARCTFGLLERNYDEYAE